MKKFISVFFLLAVVLVFAYSQDFNNTTWIFSVVSLEGKATVKGEMVFYQESVFINGTPHAYKVDDKLIFIDTLGYCIKNIDENNIELVPAFGGEQYIVRLKRK